MIKIKFGSTTKSLQIKKYINYNGSYFVQINTK